MSLTVNAYDLTIQRPIIYNYDEVTDEESYLNYDRVGTRGIDAEYRLRQDWGYAALTYAYYQVGSFLSDREDVPEPYEVQTSARALLGAPRHQVSLNAAIIPMPGLSIGPSMRITSGRWGYLSADDEGEPILDKTGATVLLNLWVRYAFEEDLPGLFVAAGVFNLLDAEELFVQPYNGYRPAIPGTGREVLVQVGYAQPLD
jgi:outer membrane receptor protein involved in Fe transport